MTTYLMQAVSSSDGLLYGWQASTPDFAAGGFTGPGSAQHVAVAGRTQGGAGLSIAKFPNDLNPFALYNFEYDLLDGSGNGRHLTGGSGYFMDIYPGFPGMLINTTQASRADQAFNLPGDVTILAMIQSNNTTTMTVFEFGGTTDAQAMNYIYSLDCYTPTPKHCLQFFSERGAGLDNLFLSPAFSTGFIHNIVWIGARRLNNKIQCWVNGVKTGAESSAFTTPDGGTTSAVMVGDGGDGAVGAIKFWNRGLSDAEVVQQYNVTMGGAFGTV